ncbi:hypothetical protein FE634_20685 [Nocardioides dongxiaopingii]|uniref:lysyl oxidase family protein n=1 Tax=Nocardioides sp. S-1144 TaxID=2582905 RepID=UPI00110E4AA0|nr:lysyl oxidase family protein [Nocardioides sp. S-1144]QCW52238.1 hypothetical protein FE634_20685 [Nocardioides sp. S-1144]
MPRHRRLAALTSVALISPLAAVVGLTGAAAPSAGQAGPARAAEPSASPSLWAPARVEGAIYGHRKLARVDLPVRLVAGSEPVELWSSRASYAEPIRTVVRTSSGDVALPAGAATSFNGLDDFLAVKVVDARTGEPVMFRTKDACLNSDGQRVRPDAAARSPYPAYCFSNPYSLGSVQGIQAGWSNPVLEQSGGAVRLPRGRYTVTTSVRAPWREALGISAADARRTVRVVVKKEHDHGEHEHRSASGPALRPAGTDGPSGRLLDEVDGPQPNLRSLPAWGISVSENGDYLRFAATVWNAGDSPLVVDGFVDPADGDRMEAYQYFFDAEGEQTGYQPVGSFEFDTKETHQHWHFRDFARYTLLRADQSTAVNSRKEAFCLANTDAVDLTVPDADWNPENTDLATDCGYTDSLSLRQVLAAGWGDTYAQFRAGQSFNLKGLPNGTYYIATIANPRGRLVESSKQDNTSLRKVVIGGKPGARTVRVPQVGMIVEPAEQW